MAKSYKDYIGANSFILGAIRINNEDYNFLEGMAVQYSWGKLATMQRMCIKFAKSDQEKFEKFLNEMRKPEEDIL